jgi:hypothetical protein
VHGIVGCAGHELIEHNWLGGTGLLHTRDAVVNNIGSVLDPARTGGVVPD